MTPMDISTTLLNEAIIRIVERFPITDEHGDIHDVLTILVNMGEEVIGPQIEDGVHRPLDILNVAVTDKKIRLEQRREACDLDDWLDTFDSLALPFTGPADAEHEFKHNRKVYEQ